MRPHKMVSEHLVLVFFFQPVKQLSDCGCKLDCGRLASVREERRAAHCLFKFVVLEAQHDAILRIGGFIIFYDSVGGVRLVLRAGTAIPARHDIL